MTDLMTQADVAQGDALNAIPIIEAWSCPIGTILTSIPNPALTPTIIMHPLDVVALKNPNPYDRLDAAMALMVQQAHARLDALAESILKGTS